MFHFFLIFNSFLSIRFLFYFYYYFEVIPKIRMLKVTDSKSLNQINYKRKTILLHFVTEWCNPCKLSRKLLQSEMPKYSNHYCLVEVNCDEAEELVLDYCIEGVPTLVSLDKQLKATKKIVGYLPEKIKDIFKKKEIIQ